MTIASGLPTYQDLETTIEKIVAMKVARWSFPGMDTDDISQEIRLICFQALQKYDLSKEGKGVFYFLAKCVDNRLYNHGRGIYFDNNPPCTRCPDYNKVTKICCGSPRKSEYDLRMARRRAIDNPISLHSAASEDESISDILYGTNTYIGSSTGVVDLDEHISDLLHSDLLDYYQLIKNGNSNDVPITIRRKIRDAVRRITNE